MEDQVRLRWEDMTEGQIVVESYWAEAMRGEKWYTHYYKITKMNPQSAWLDRCTKEGDRGFLAGLGERVPRNKVPRWVLKSSMPQINL